MSHPTPAELEILQVLWRLGEASAQTVNEALQATRPVGYTATLKQLQLMHEKGLVSRDKVGRSDTYSAQLAESTTKSNLLSRFIESTFGGSAGALIMQLMDAQKVSAEEREAIAKLLREQEGEQ